MAKTVTFRTIDGGEFKLERDFCEQHKFLASVTPAGQVAVDLSLWSDDFRNIVKHYRGEVRLADLPKAKRAILHKYVEFVDPEMQLLKLERVKFIKKERKKLTKSWFHTYGHKKRLIETRKSLFTLLSSLGKETLDFINMSTEQLLTLSDRQLEMLVEWFKSNADNFR